MNSTEAPVLSLSNPCFLAYLLSTCLLVLKMVFVVFLTVYKRRQTRTFLSPEDAAGNDGTVDVNENVERVRRAHLNDLENIPIFCFAAFAFLFTKPNVIVAFGLYFTFVVARILHTIVYAVVVIPQPARAICFLTGLLIICYMTMHCIVYFFMVLL